MNHHPFHLKATASILLMSMVSACAVSPQDVRDAERVATEQIAKAKASSDDRLREAPLVEYVNANYLGGDPMPLSTATTLPPVFRERKVRLLGTASVKDHAEVVTNVIGVPIRINPDVWTRPMPRRTMTTTSGAVATTTATAGVSPQPSPAGMPPGNPLVPSSTPQSIALAAFTNYADPSRVAMDFAGNPEQALDALTRPLGLSWEYSREDNVVTIYRYYTKTYRIKSGAGTVKASGAMDKGTSSGGGGTGSGSGGASTGASFTAANNLTVTDTITPLESVLTTIQKNFLTADGTATANSATSSITVTDSRYVVDQISRYVEAENSMLSKQVAVTIQTISVQLDNTSEKGFDLGAVYSRLVGNAAEWSMKFTAPSTLVGQTAGAFGFNILSPTSRWNGSTVNLQSLEGFGKTIVTDSRTLVTKNRVPTAKFKLDTQEYVNRTTPGASTLAGSSVVGLEQTSVTTGNLLTVTPTIYDSNTVELSLAVDDSTLLPFEQTTAGSGASAQTVKSAHTTGDVARSVVEVRDGESLVLIGVSNDRTTSTNRFGIGGASARATKGKVMSVIVVTPKILEGA